MTEPPTSGVKPANPDEAVRRRSRQRTRRSFLVGGGAMLSGAAALRWLATRPEEDGLAWPLRRALRANESLWSRLTSRTRRAPEFASEQAAPFAKMRVNGRLGLGPPAAPDEWRLAVDSDRGPALKFSLDDVRAVRATSMITELKCVEGWSQVMAFGGASLADFLVHYGLGTRSGAPPRWAEKPDDLYRYVALETPDAQYYVGFDMQSALHPQTLLCWAMAGQPLTAEHGAPLRLVSALKYGYKNLKRIGRIRFTDQRPADYWAERGYDWFAGH